LIFSTIIITIKDNVTTTKLRKVGNTSISTVVGEGAGVFVLGSVSKTTMKWSSELM